MWLGSRTDFLGQTGTHVTITALSTMFYFSPCLSLLFCCLVSLLVSFPLPAVLLPVYCGNGEFESYLLVDDGEVSTSGKVTQKMFGRTHVDLGRLGHRPSNTALEHNDQNCTTLFADRNQRLYIMPPNAYTKQQLIAYRMCSLERQVINPCPKASGLTRCSPLLTIPISDKAPNLRFTAVRTQMPGPDRAQRRPKTSLPEVYWRHAIYFEAHNLLWELSCVPTQMVAEADTHRR